MIPYERCQEPSCPLTKGWENINHSVVPGCVRYGKFFEWKPHKYPNNYSFQRMEFAEAHFLTPFNSEPKTTLTKTNMRPIKATIQEHKQLSPTKMFHSNCNKKSDDSDYPDLTSDSGDDFDSDS